MVRSRRVRNISHSGRCLSPRQPVVSEITKAHVHLETKLLSANGYAGDNIADSEWLTTGDPWPQCLLAQPSFRMR